MSIFGKFKESRRVAKEHSEYNNTKGKEAEPVKTPYKHVPTHAAIDALSGAPSSWKAEDAPKIRAHHKRRSEMMRSRTGSSLSTSSMPNIVAGPSSSAPVLPRSSSYNTYNPTWNDRTGDVSSQMTVPPKMRVRGHSYHDSGLGPSIGPSPLGSNVQSENITPVGSSGNSLHSDSSQLARYTNSLIRVQPIVYKQKDIFAKLQTNNGRKIGEAPILPTPPASIKSPKAVQEEQKQKKPRWILMEKNNNSAINV